MTLVLSGKAGLTYRDGAVVRDASRRTLLDQLDQSLRDLGTDHLDLWQVHRWDDKTPLDETLATRQPLSRQQLDEFSLASHEKAAAAMERSLELVPALLGVDRCPARAGAGRLVGPPRALLVRPVEAARRGRQ